MKMIIIDLEMNQPSNKIIEIGACLVDLKRKKILDSFSSLCNPGELPSEFITELTGITKEMVLTADNSTVVHARFWEWVENCKVGGVLGAWGGDVYLIREESKELGINIPVKIQNYDLKKFIGILRSAMGGKVKGGLSNAMSLFNVDDDSTAHRAYNDAVKTAKLMFTIYSKIERMFRVEKEFSQKGI